MNHKLKGALIGLIAIVVVYIGAAWVIGIVVQSQLQRDQQRLLGVSGYLVADGGSYQRGLFSSTEQLSYQLSPPLRQVAGRAAGIQALTALRATLSQRIYHGPLPRLRGFALASIDSQLQLAPAQQASLPSVLAGRPLVRLHTSLGWLGSVHTRILSPAFQQGTAAAGLVRWGAVSGEFDGTRGLSSWSLSLTAPGLLFQNAVAHVTLSGLSVDIRRRRVFDTLSVGDSALQLAQVQLRAAAGTPLLITGLRLRSASSVDAQYIEQSVELTADSVQAAQFSATDVGYQQTAAHLHGPSLAALERALRAAQQHPGDVAGEQGAILAAFRQYGPPLAMHEPVLDISRIGFVMPQGALRLSARLSLPGMAQEAPQSLQGAAGLASILQHLQVAADLRIDTALADALPAGSARQGMYAAQIQQLLRQGYLRRDGGAYVCHVSYVGGRLRINDQPFPPQPGASQPSVP